MLVLISHQPFEGFDERLVVLAARAPVNKDQEFTLTKAHALHAETPASDSTVRAGGARCESFDMPPRLVDALGCFERRIIVLWIFVRTNVMLNYE